MTIFIIYFQSCTIFIFVFRFNSLILNFWQCKMCCQPNFQCNFCCSDFICLFFANSYSGKMNSNPQQLCYVAYKDFLTKLYRNHRLKGLTRARNIYSCFATWFCLIYFYNRPFMCEEIYLIQLTLNLLYETTKWELFD